MKPIRIKIWTNEEMDKKVLNVLGDFGLNYCFSEICNRLHIDPTGKKDTHFREVDRSLQRLRKAGKIIYNHKTGWFKK